ncbi:zinc-dependent alcohol dehydrogenase [Rhodococcus triatomae]|nr:theronine dehydrogenase-like Zn-dependent dehydrogenase [Rhodococcus triatomae BKS 15-14]
MRAAVIAEDRSIDIIEIPDPTPGAGEVRIRVSRSGICGSDLHALHNPRYPSGAVMGHEVSGVIDELGSDVTNWQVGQRVALYHGTPCGHCSTCRAGHSHICRNHLDTALGLGTVQGGMAELIVVNHTLLHALPDDVSDEAGSVAEPLAIAIHGVVKGQVDPDVGVVVLGAGPIGAMVACALRARGSERVVVVDPNPLRRAAMSTMGFAAVDLEDVGSSVRGHLGGRPSVVFECSGHPTAAGLAVSLADSAGRVVLQGVPLEPVALSQFAVVQKELDIIGAASCTPSELDEALQHIQAGRIPVEQLVSVVAPLSEAGRYFADLTHGDGRHLKVQLDPTA